MCEHGILHIERPAAHVHTQSGCVHVCVCVYRGPCKWLSVCARWCARAFAARGVTFKFSAIAGLIVVHDALHFVDACGSGDVRASLCAVWCACACVGVFFFALLSSTPHSPRYWVNPGRDGVRRQANTMPVTVRSHTLTPSSSIPNMCVRVCSRLRRFLEHHPLNEFLGAVHQKLLIGSASEQER